MLTPWLLGFLAFTAGPLVASLVLSFTNYDVFDPVKWVGLTNFSQALNDPLFWNSWKVTVIYGVVGTFYSLAIALAAGLLLYQARYLSGFWRTLLYFPTLLGGAAEGLIMTGVWNPQAGLANGILRIVGVHGPAWVDDPRWAFAAVILMRYWTIGTAMLLFLGARAGVDPQLYEAARMDGAGPLRQLRSITLPMISPILLLNLLLGIIGSFQAFAQVYILTRGGPGNATDLLGIFIYRESFQNLRLGYGSAVSWSMFSVLLVLTFGILGGSRRFVYYETGERW
jgi:multiple sugar transport system permease protein